MDVELNFKEIYTANTQKYLVNQNWSTYDLKNNLVSKIMEDFNITQNEDFEIVESGQYVQGIPPELAPSLNISNNIILRDLFNNLKNTSFYIRKIVLNAVNIITPITTIITNLIDIRPNYQECMVCWSSDNITHQSFGCTHYICNECNNQCIYTNNNRCPCCRRTRR
jgi:hypothetical protein